MTAAFAVILVIHGLLHLLGFAKAFHLAELPQLTEPIPALAGIGWLVAAVLFVAAAVALFAWPRGCWILGAAGLVLSSAVIVPAWSDAKAGMLANAIVLVGVVFGFLARGPFSLRAAYDHDVRTALAYHEHSTEIVREADLAHLPALVQRYLRVAGVVGQPRVTSVRARMHGRLRSGPDARWIPLSFEQVNVFAPPARLFYMSGTMMMIPVQGYHRYVGAAATMHVKAAALVPVAEAAGVEMTQSETVTLFNDMCVLAPATLIDPAIVWEDVRERSVRAVYANAGHTIRAELFFNDAGELADFASDDRYQLGPDGRSVKRVRWSTPIRAYRSFGAAHLGSGGAAVWHEPSLEYAYIELTIDDIQYNL